MREWGRAPQGHLDPKGHLCVFPAALGASSPLCEVVCPLVYELLYFLRMAVVSPGPSTVLGRVGTREMFAKQLPLLQLLICQNLIALPQNLLGCSKGLPSLILPASGSQRLRILIKEARDSSKTVFHNLGSSEGFGDSFNTWPATPQHVYYRHPSPTFLAGSSGQGGS